MQRNNNSIMIFEIIRGGELTGWGKNGTAYFFPGERMGRPILSPGKKLTGGKFRPVTPGQNGTRGKMIQRDFSNDDAMGLNDVCYSN